MSMVSVLQSSWVMVMMVPWSVWPQTHGLLGADDGAEEGMEDGVDDDGVDDGVDDSSSSHTTQLPSAWRSQCRGATKTLRTIRLVTAMSQRCGMRRQARGSKLMPRKFMEWSGVIPVEPHDPAAVGLEFAVQGRLEDTAHHQVVDGHEPLLRDAPPGSRIPVDAEEVHGVRGAQSEKSWR
jgi:hypothetical protein